MLALLRWISSCSRFCVAWYQVVARMSSPLTVATGVVLVTGARPNRPEVSARRKPPTNRMTMIIQMYFAEARIACSKALTPFCERREARGDWRGLLAPPASPLASLLKAYSLVSYGFKSCRCKSRKSEDSCIFLRSVERETGVPALSVQSGG